MRKLSAKACCGVFLAIALIVVSFAGAPLGAAGSISIVPEEVNGKFASIDAEFYGRAVTPDMFDGADDTEKVQKAFDSGKPVVFTRNYQVRSVVMRGANQQIDFNGYWLLGITGTGGPAADKECVLQISGIYLSLYNIKVDAQCNPNYIQAIRWRSLIGSNPAMHNKIYGLEIKNAIVGMLFGSYTDDPNPYDTSQSENNIYTLKIHNVQKGLLLHQPNGFLKITGGMIKVGAGDWAASPNSAFYNTDDEICVYNKFTALTIENCDLIKDTTAGYGLRGRDIYLSDCGIDIAGAWGLIEGEVHISNTKNGRQLSGIDLFQIAPDVQGMLIVDGTRTVRDFAGGAPYVVSGLSQAPSFYAVIKNSSFIGWSYDRAASVSERRYVCIEDTLFDSAGLRVTLDDRTGQVKKGGVNALEGVDLTGLIMTSPNGTQFIVSIDAAGQYITTPLGDVSPAITGLTNLTLHTGYAATSTSAYVTTGTEPVTVSKTSGDAKITWNDTTKALDIAEGLAAGMYVVTLNASNGTLPDAELTFTLTITTLKVELKGNFKKGDGTQVSPEDITLHVVAQASGSASYNNTNAAMGQGNGKFMQYDIRLNAGDKKVQPASDSTVRVTLPIPEDYKTNHLKAYSIDDHGKVRSMSVLRIENGYITFEAVY